MATPGYPRVYLDHMASTPIDEAVLEAMLPWLRAAGNPHSRHDLGQRAHEVVEKARSQIASLIGADRLSRIVFTSGATEATNIALRGLELKSGSRCVTSTIEHSCVRETLADMARGGGVTTEIAVGADGIVDLDALSEAVAEEPALVTLMAVNNEVGTIQPFREAARSCQAAGVAFHSDMTQALGRIPFDVATDGVDMASFSAHKIGGPQGIGALYMANWIDLRPISTGGGQEDGLRPGTVPTALVVGFGEACALAKRTMAKEGKRITGLRDRFLEKLREAGVAFQVNGSLERRVPSNLSLRLGGVDAGSLIDSLFDVCLSTGSACRSGAMAPSHVLAAMGLDARASFETIRVSLGTSTADDVTTPWSASRARPRPMWYARPTRRRGRRLRERSPPCARRMRREGRRPSGRGHGRRNVDTQVARRSRC